VPAGTLAGEAIAATGSACATTQGIGEVERDGRHIATVSYVLVVTYHDATPAAHAATPGAPHLAAAVSGMLWRIVGDLWRAGDGRPLVLRLADGGRLPCHVTRGSHPESPARLEAAGMLVGGSAW
jgi:hypothetical protein